jgi:hypothetical protein
VASTRKMLDGACLAGIPTGRVGGETALRTAKLLARYQLYGLPVRSADQLVKNCKCPTWNELESGGKKRKQRPTREE